jgi:hypothetical protein
MSVFPQRVKDASEAAGHQLIGPEGRGITVYLQADDPLRAPRDR